VDNSDGSVETSFKPEKDPSRMSVLMETEETVETMEGVLAKTTEVGLGDSDGIATVVDDGTCNKGERTVGGRKEMMQRLIRIQLMSALEKVTRKRKG
jgi:hypothetical protein